MFRSIIPSLSIVLAAASSVRAVEPNETFSARTVLAPGTLSVTDSLQRGPDTILAALDMFGGIYDESDNDGPYANTNGSGLQFVPMDSGSFDFLVSGFDDFNYDGSHSETGRYEVVVDVYDFFDDLVASFSDVFLLEAGEVDPFSDSDFEWIDGSYDVYTRPIGDVDFFTFTGLTAGEPFTATTVDTGGINIDTLLGWFDSSGNFIDENEDIDPENGVFQSMLTGIVPAGGQLTFAVSGFGDIEYAGNHITSGNYQLVLDFGTGEPDGDYNEDGAINAADYVVWRKGEADGPYETWRENFGAGSAGGGSAVPEPTGIVLLLSGIAALTVRNRGNSS
jgi:hypothetical protein